MTLSVRKGQVSIENFSNGSFHTFVHQWIQFQLKKCIRVQSFYLHLP